MKKATVVIASLLLGVFGLAVQIHATQQEAGQVKQHITRRAKTIAAHASVLYKGSPQFLPIGGTSISYATNTPLEVINILDRFSRSALRPSDTHCSTLIGTIFSTRLDIFYLPVFRLLQKN